MRNAQKPDHISLNNLVSRLRDGRYVIPDFQRDFAWKPWDIRDLVGSVFRDYYIGSLLLWKGKAENFDALSCEPIYGHVGSGNREHIVLDGQQRLTAIHYALIAPDVALPGRTSRAYYFIAVDRFTAQDYDNAFEYQWSTRYWDALIADPVAQFESHLFPLSVIGEGGYALANWAQGYERHWKERSEAAEKYGDAALAAAAASHAELARRFGQDIYETTQQYQISFVELDEELGVDKICDIFTQINSRGVQLDIFDLMNAMLKPRGVQLKALWREAETRFEGVTIDKMNVYVLQVMSILRQAYCSPKYLSFLLPGVPKPVREDGGRRTEVLIESGEDFVANWREAVQVIEHSLALLRHPQEYGVSRWTYLPYKTIIPVFSALQNHIQSLPPEVQLDAQRKFRLWYWASVFTNQYSASSESKSARDFQDVRDWIADDAAIPPAIVEFRNGFRSLPLEGETKQGTSRYNGVFNLYVLNGARDWISGQIPRSETLQDHHIIPRSWGAKHLDDRINSILNRCPLTAETNRDVISDRLPNTYLPDLISRNGEAQVRAILESHFISAHAFDILLRNPFTPADYAAFLNERYHTIVQAIEALLIKERLDLPSHLRLLDAEIEQVELRLRTLIAKVLDEDVGRVPTDLRPKVDGRIAQASRSATFDLAKFERLSGWLEFADFRELQMIITNGLLWNNFSDRFGAKPALDGKFGQVANLRNSIRHSRHIDQVGEMEGRAAILWFGTVLNS